MAWPWAFVATVWRPFGSAETDGPSHYQPFTRGTLISGPGSLLHCPERAFDGRSAAIEDSL